MCSTTACLLQGLVAVLVAVVVARGPTPVLAVARGPRALAVSFLFEDGTRWDLDSSSVFGAGAGARSAVDASLATCPSEPYRPLVHFSPRAFWMNDPNGLLYADGEWHLFFQFNPHGDTPGNISWGHAVSEDLVHWTELSAPGRAAIPFDGDRELIFSGSAVLDRDNTSGFGTTENPPMVAIYTSANDTKQAQSLAYSLDAGRTWTKYAGNPVLDEDEKEFRDPKVQWHAPTRRWLMAVAMADERKIRFYSSPDLKAWTLLSDFGPRGAIVGQYECPDLFPLPVDGDLDKIKWVLVVNVNPGGLHGGSSAQYFLGDFDGERFVEDAVEDPKAVRWLDFGKDYYAAVSWVDAPDGQRYMIGWMSNWQYAASTPTSPWRNAMSVPRLMSLRSRADGGVDLVQEPVPALVNTLRRGAEALSATDRNLTSGSTMLLADGCDGAFLLDAKIVIGDATRVALRVRAPSDGAGGTVIVYDVDKAELAIDRRTSGRTDFSQHFSGVHGAPLVLGEDRELQLRLVVDAGSVEVFAQGGRVAITDIIFPEEASKAVLLAAEGGDADFRDVRITPLTPYRPACATRKNTCHLV